MERRAGKQSAAGVHNLIRIETNVWWYGQNSLTTRRFLRTVNIRFYHARSATCPVRLYQQRAGHSSIPDPAAAGLGSFLAPYDDTTSSRSSPGDPKSATPDQRCFQTRASAWLGASAPGRDNPTDVVDRHCAEGNYCWQAGVRVARGFHGRRLVPGTTSARRLDFCGPERVHNMAGESITNRKALRDYRILERYEAGIELKGSEVKSIRAGKANIGDAFARIENGEAFLYNADIQPYERASHEIPAAKRIRKLLLHRQEIDKLYGETQVKGRALVVLKLYWKNGKLKAELGVGQGKVAGDKRADLKKRAIDRETAREVARFNRKHA